MYYTTMKNDLEVQKIVKLILSEIDNKLMGCTWKVPGSNLLQEMDNSD
jgi:hypothetical protein